MTPAIHTIYLRHTTGEESAALVIGVSGECKVVLVVPRELNLTPGKLGSQCAHASIGIYRVLTLYQCVRY